MIMFRRIAPLVLGALLVGCEDDSTGPGDVDLRVVASSFDALSRSRTTVGDGSGAMASRHAALALRAGVRPTRVNIAVDGVTQEYWALEVEHALAPDLTESPVLTLPIVSRTMVAWRGAPAERVISITISSDTGTFGWARYTANMTPVDRIYYDPAFGIMFERGGPAYVSVDGGARSTRQAIGSECALPRPSAVMPLLPPVSVPSTCHAALFFTRFTMRADELVGGDAWANRSRVIEMTGQDVRGIRLEHPLIARPCPVCL